MLQKTWGFIGNFFIILSLIRVVLGSTLITKSVLLGYLSAIPILILFVAWEKKNPTTGLKRLRRGLSIFFVTLLLDIALLIIF